MTPLTLHAIIFLEGFCSLGAEVIALRRLTPYLGSSIIVTAPTIGFFLLALALGYAAGGRVDREHRPTVGRNFLIAGTLAGLGLAAPTLEILFAHLPAPLAYLLFVGGILAPIAWLLGQTVPILTNLMRCRDSGEASGQALYWSTLGSFLGSLMLSLLVMQWLGVFASVLLCAGGLLLGALVLQAGQRSPAVAAIAVGAASLALNLNASPTRETTYADYRTTAVELAGYTAPRAFFVNQSTASLIDRSEPPRYARYVEYLRHLLLEEFALRDEAILVLGAGGFTLSHREPSNRYTYVDVDPSIRRIAEEDFLHEPIRGRFVVDDARHYLGSTREQYRAVVVDVFSSHTAIPSHLVTREFWTLTRRALTPDGLLLANLILDPRLESDYARHLLATIESVYGRCAVNVLQKDKPLANVEVLCHASSQPRPVLLYIDERNRADLDLARSR